MFRHYTTVEGLSQDWVTDIFQDSRGFVWIATQNGLNRFDGHRFKLYFYDDADTNSLSVNYVTAIEEDPQGNLWFGTYGKGLNRFDPRTETFTRFPLTYGSKTDVSAGIFKKLFWDQKGRLWAAASPGLFLFRADADSVHFEQFSESPAFDITHDRDGRLWAAMQDGLFYLDDSLTHFQPAGKQRIAALWYDAVKNSLWFFDENSLKELDLNNYNIREQNIAGIKIINNAQRAPVLQDRRQRLWVGAAAQLTLLNTDGELTRLQHLPTEPQGLGRGHINVLFEDREGNIWIGTSGGISLLPANAGRFQAKDFPIAQVKATGAVLPDGDFVWHSSPQGLFRWRRGTLGTGELVLRRNIRSLLKTRDGYVWAGIAEGEASGFYRINPVSLETRFWGKRPGQYHTFRGNDVLSLAEDKNGRLWVGAWGNAQCFDPKTEIFIHFDSTWNTLCNSTPCLDLLIDDMGDLWVATMGCGLFRLKQAHNVNRESDARWENFRHTPLDNNSLGSNTVMDLCQTTPDTIWVGTDGGLNAFYPQRGTFQRYRFSGAVTGDKILKIIPDGRGRLWISTDGQGIVSFNCGSGQSVRFTMRDGLYSDAFKFGSAARDTAGILFFGNEQGIQIFNPDVVFFLANKTPPLYFTELVIDGTTIGGYGRDSVLAQNISFADGLVLRPGHKIISLQFAALESASPSKTVYFIRMEGLYDGWRNNSFKPEVSYANLPPGQYTMRVKAVNPDRGWVALSAPLSIRVLPPWYLSWGAYALYTAVAAGVVFALYFFQLRRRLAAAETRRLQELDAVKTKLYTNITHEFRTPLTVILGETAQLEKQAGENQKGGLAAIRRQGCQLLNLVNQMLDLAKVEAGSLPIHLTQINVVLFLKYLLESFHSLADSKQIELRFESDTDEFWMDCDPRKLQQIVSNLLSNAVKFTPQNGRVEMRVASEGVASLTSEGFGTLPTLAITVSDTGQGIPPEKLPFVFDRFYQADDSATRQTEGTGIGLTLVKELVQLLGGDVRAESPPPGEQKGTAFIVTLPVRRTAEKQTTPPDEFFSENEGAAPVDKTLPAGKTPPRSSDARAQLLIVEDNADVVRYLSSLLADEYQIQVAPNGKIGVESAFRLVPDLVISDVMMPEMDGFELCRALKIDFRTSHIPVILLTAKADLDSRLEGLEHGADAYLAKPFEERELRVHLRKLNELRQALQKRYGGHGLPALSDSPIFQREDVFFEKLLAQLERHFSNDAFGVPELCAAMDMTRPTLFRKLTALTGKNIEDYLRIFRLRKAYEMLQTTSLTVEKVAWDCGFKEPANFSRAFYAEFGFPPSSLRS